MPSSCASLRLLLEEFPVQCARAVRTLNLMHYFRVLVSGVWVLLTSTKIEFFGRRLFSWEQCLVLQWIHALRQYFGYGRISHIFYDAADSIPVCVSSPFTLNGEECPVDASGCSFAPRSSHLDHWTIFSSFT